MTLDEAIAIMENPTKHTMTCSQGELTAWLKELKERREDASQTTKCGKWISKADMDYVDKNKVEHYHGMCSECKLIYDFVDLVKWFSFCPRCGADMRG